MTGGEEAAPGSPPSEPAGTPLRHRIFRMARRVPGIPAFERRLRMYLLTHDLRCLNEVLARTPLAGRYRVFGGVLLGWAREGGLLRHDLNDVDFAYDEADHERFLAAVPAIERAGFRRRYRYRSNDGQFTEHCFVRHGAKFEFFRFERVDNRYRYHLYAIDPADPRRHVEMLCEIAAQPVEPFEFLGRTWSKPLDHEAELESIYGDWRTPDPTWTMHDERSLVARREWDVTSSEWT